MSSNYIEKNMKYLIWHFAELPLHLWIILNLTTYFSQLHTEYDMIFGGMSPIFGTKMWVIHNTWIVIFDFTVWPWGKLTLSI